MMDDRVVRLLEADAERAAAVLVRAFRDDPFHVYLFPDPNERDRLWLALYTAAVRFGCLYGESWAVTDPAGEALTAVVYGFPVPGGEFTPERMERSAAPWPTCGVLRTGSDSRRPWRRSRRPNGS